MAGNLNFKISKSITNPDVDIRYALDAREPLSFLDFIKNIDNIISAEVSQNYYIEYLRNWNQIKNVENEDGDKTIIENCRNFIKDVSLNFTNDEEKRFLSQIDFNDPLDLELVVPFYSRKLIEITNFYNQKREELKYQVIKKKMIGTSDLLKSEIRKNIINYLESLPDGSYSFNIDDVKQDLNIEVEELYDGYPSYFNQEANERIYDNKDLDYDLNLFLRDNSDIITQDFADFTTEQLELKEINDLLDNKRKLTKKYIGSDYYFLLTGSTVTDFISGVLFTADNPSRNFFNIDNPTTASTDRKFLLTPEEIGYFRPHKTSIINIDGEISTFSYNLENVEPNTIYYFPDPNIRGNNGEILTFVNNDDYVRRNFTSGKSKNIPWSKKDDTKYYGYTSRIEHRNTKYLEDVFSSGYIQDSKSDIYNNLFGLFKNDGSFTKTIINNNTPTRYYQILNGHTFYDFLYDEGYNFNYSTYDDTTYDSTIRSGLSSFTGNFSFINQYYQVFGGNFTNDYFHYSDEYLPDFQTFDGAFFSDGDVPYIDTVSSDLSAYEYSGSYYYSVLLEGGVNNLTKPQRALLDPLFPSLTANLSLNLLPNGLSSFMVDGQFFSSDYEELSPLIPTIRYDDTVLKNSEYILSASSTNNLYDRLTLKGELYVRNSYTMKVSKIGSEMGYLSGVLPLSAYTECLSAVESFDLNEDLMIIKTENNLIFTPIEFENGIFNIPSKQTFNFSFNKTPFNKITNTYKKDNLVYFAILNQIEPISMNNIRISPTIYELDLEKYRISTYSADIPDITIDNIDFTYIDTPKLSYNRRKDIFNISFLLKDDLKQFSIVDIEYRNNPFKLLKLNQYDQK